MFKNWVPTVGGIMVGLGTLPGIVTASHIAFPLWWNSLQFPLYLTGAIGAILLGIAAKGVDQHSTPAQVSAAGAAVVAMTPEQIEQAKVQAVQADAQIAKKP